GQEEGGGSGDLSQCPRERGWRLRGSRLTPLGALSIIISRPASALVILIYPHCLSLVYTRRANHTYSI
ncbi:MAG: hypothetical protein P8Y28_07915, partial [Gammaproteobacteria bacterium]